MKIAASTIDLRSSHESVEEYQRREQLTVWRDGEEPRQIQTPRLGASLRVMAHRLEGELATARISRKAHTLHPTKARLELEPKNEEETTGDPKISLIKMLVEKLTGREFKIAKPEDFHQDAADPDTASPPAEGQPSAPPASAPERQGWGLVYDYYESHYQRETTHFSAQGIIQTQDGKRIEIQIELGMSRELLEEQSINLRAGDALKDPLVLNFDGTAAELTETKYSFDLDLDGREDQISFVTAGSGFLALDRNNDGTINDGSELFGPSSGNGFSELAAYDADGNDWIDENDDIYSQLRIWTKDADGNDQLFALGQKGVGAIYLGHVSTPFLLADQNNEQQGQIQSTGLFLEEEGGVGTLQHVDLVV